VLVLCAALLAFAGGRAQAQGIDPTWDHYHGYLVLNQVLHNEQVTLTDQFGTRIERTFYLEWFANPTEKQHGTITYPINHPELHYAWWAITQQPFSKDVIATNQFGDQPIHIGQTSDLLNPAVKNAPTQTPPPIANHYLAYECTGPAIDVPLILTDQFGTRQAVHLVPRYFCTPCSKTGENSVVYPIVDPTQHYLVYDIDFIPPAQQFTATFTDQFVSVAPLQLSYDRLLMVPSLKSIPTETHSDSWGRIKKLYR
jgi:hypothetical protein